MTAQTTLLELALLFLRLGATAFGGPAAHIAMMHDEVVRRRGWMSEERFLDLLGATNLIPGPNSTEMAIHIGWERRRWPGLAVAGLAFIVPAAAMAGALGWVYVRYHSVPAAQWLLRGVKPVILAVVLQAIWSLAPKAIRTRPLLALAVAAAILSGVGVNELAVLLGAGLVALGMSRWSGSTRSRSNPGALLVPIAPWVASASAGAAGAIALPSLFGVFVKIGSVLFGSGYVLLAFLRSDLVERLGWLTESQLIDAVAIGQITPGPVFTTATFIGYLLSGPAGALVATGGIFLPAFVFVALSGPLIPRLRASPTAGAFLDGVNAASLALMATVTLQLGRGALLDVLSVALFLGAGVLLIRFRVNATWLLIGGAAAAYAAQALR